MKDLHLTEKENETLQNVLEGALSDIRAEIAHTDSPFFKDQLRDRKETMKHILDELKHEENA